MTLLPFSQGSLIGMVHLLPLPGSPGASMSVDAIARQAASEAKVLVESGYDGIIVENMHDRPYVNGPHAPETVAAMTVCTHAVRNVAPGLPLGVQILSMGHREALGVAIACDAQFIRVENFVYAHVADEGLLAEATAGPLLRARRSLGASHIALLCDIKKKHASHALTADLSIVDIAHGAEFAGADGLVVTGAFTGSPTDPSEVRAVRGATGCQVFVGSGATPQQLPGLIPLTDGIIVGSWIKKDGQWTNPVDPRRAEAMVQARRLELGQKG